jgi:glycosyltransferase involved in cell wall biosynthesis
MESPRISVITVSYNAAKHIEDTILSIVEQTYPNIEYIIVDGASTDNTASIIEKYQSKITHFISEPDQGIYDAMNKGLKRATGEYVCFINADDQLSDKNILSDIFAKNKPADIYYGETYLMDESGKLTGTRSEMTQQKLPAQLSWKSLEMGMVVSHQSFIVKRTIAPFYNLEYPICADIDWMINCLKRATTIINTQSVISKFRTGGVSKLKQQQAWKERFKVLQYHYGVFANCWNHFLIIARYLLSPRKNS